MTVRNCYIYYAFSDSFNEYYYIWSAGEGSSSSYYGPVTVQFTLEFSNNDCVFIIIIRSAGPFGCPHLIAKSSRAMLAA